MTEPHRCVRCGAELAKDDIAMTRKMINRAHKMGVPKGMDPFITLSFMALPVIPSIRCTPRGVYSVSKGKFLYRG